MRSGYERITVRDAPRFLNNYGQIMQTKVRLYEFAVARDKSVEYFLDLLSPEESEGDWSRTRDRITQGLQKEETGITLSDLNLGRFASQAKDNSEVSGVLYSLIKFVAEKFVKENPALVEDIKQDDGYRLSVWDDNIAQYIAQAVCETLGIL